MSGTSTGDYRTNANHMSTDEKIAHLEEKVSKQGMTSEHTATVKIVKNSILGVLAFTTMCYGGCGYMNNADNSTKVQIAKQCPAVSPILAVGLTQSASAK